MFEDAPVNTGAVQWPDADSAFWTVRRMQIKLHRWASEDPARRFGDLFNLVYDPAFLVHAWERVSSNAGARTPGVDRATVAQIVSRVGVEAFPGPRPGLAEVGRVRAGRGAAGDDPEGESGSSASWVSRPSRTGWSRRASRRCWNPSSRRTSSRARMGSAPGAARRTRSLRSIFLATRSMSGCWRPTSRRVSTRSGTRRCWTGCGPDQGQAGPGAGEGVPEIGGDDDLR